jgi:hypothetical protein
MKENIAYYYYVQYNNTINCSLGGRKQRAVVVRVREFLVYMSFTS